jgi:site-specific recombinase XerD
MRCERVASRASRPPRAVPNCTHLLKGKASIRHVQELLGQQSLQSTAIYTRVGVEDLRAGIER